MDAVLLVISETGVVVVEGVTQLLCYWFQPISSKSGPPDQMTNSSAVSTSTAEGGESPFKSK